MEIMIKKKKQTDEDLSTSEYLVVEHIHQNKNK